MATNFLSLRSSAASSISAVNLTGSAITTSTITVSTLNLQSTTISLGQSTNQTYNNFSNGSYLTWATAKSAMTSANKTVQSANGLYQMLVANATSGLFLSSDSGITWSTLSGGLPTLTGSAYWSDGAISANGQYMTLSIYGGSLWMSADYGRTFALTNQPTPNIWLPLNGNTTDSMGLSVVTATGSPGYVTLNYPGYTAQAVNLLNTAGAAPTRYIQGTWAGATNFTVSFWFNAQTNSSGTIFSSSSGQTQIYLFGNYLYYATMINGSFANAAGTSYVISSNTWYYVTATFLANGLCSLYVNNTLIGSATNTTALSAVSSYYLGCNSSITGAFNGYVDDLRIYNSVSTYVPIPHLQPNIWMPFENSTADLGSNAITPTVTGSLSYVPGIIGLNAVNLANTAGGTATNYIRGAWSLPSNFTISFWLNQQSSSSSQPQMIFSSAGGTVAIVFNTSNQIYANFLTGGGSSYTAITTSFTFSTNTWYHIYYLFQTGGTCALYVNGVSVGSFTNTSGIGTQTTTAFGLGTYEVSTNNIALNGYIDDFRVYNAAIPIHVLFPQNYRSLALSGTGQYALAAAASGWVVGSSNSSQTWSKQAVNVGTQVPATPLVYVGTQGDTIQPNKASLTQNSWEQNGVNWASSVSSVLSGIYAAYYVFNGVDTGDSWTSAQTYTNGPYTGSVSTTVIGIGAVNGEWIQIQSSIPLVLQSYRYTCAVNAHVMSKYYIVGSTDAISWYPIQYVVFSSNPFTAWNQPITTSITVNSTGTQSVTAGNTVNLTSTAYASSTTNVYNYFRIIGTETFTGGSYNELCEFYPIFMRPSSISRPPASLLSLNHTGQYQMIATGSAAGFIMPNSTLATSNTWTTNGVSWTSSGSSSYVSIPNIYYVLFNTAAAAEWVSSASAYNSSGNTSGFNTTFYTNGSSTSTIQGDYIQLQSSTPVVMSSYQLANSGEVINFIKSFYIVGSNDGTTWYAIQYAIVAAQPTAVASTFLSNAILVNSASAQTFGTSTMTTTTYTGTTNSYTYFRMIIVSTYNPSAYHARFTEWLISFQNSVSYSSNYGSTWLNTSSVVSNESVALSASGQYALSTNSVAPLARLTLDNTNVDAQGRLTIASVVGTSYSDTIVKVGTRSAFFNNTPGASAPTNYLLYTIPTVLNTPSMLTMMGWIHPTSFGSANYPTPFTLCNSTSSSGPAFFVQTNGLMGIVTTTTTNTGGSGLLSSVVASLNTWYHLAVVYGNNTVSLYINGTLNATSSYSGLLCLGGGGSLTHMIIGGNAPTTGGSFAGYVDDVRIYTSALNADEINGLYKNPALTQTIAVSNSYLPITGYSEPTLPSITANVVDTAVSQTGQYMVAVTSSTTNNVYYSTDFGATFTALTIGTAAMVSCSISYDGSYLTVESATTVHTLNRNTRGFSVAVGNQAGFVNQAQNAIAIGDKAGRTNQSANSIVLNASGSALDAVAPGFYVAPIATAGSSSATSFGLLGYGTDNQVTQTNLTVLSNGNVGINATNPMYKTQIVLGSNSDPGTSNIFALTTADSGAVSQRLYMGLVDNGGSGSNSYSWISASRYGYAYNSLALQPVGGNVGIGITNPVYPLSVQGHIQALNTTNDVMGLFSPSYGNFIHIGAWNAQGSISKNIVMNYLGGNVGIGMSTPNAPLHVIGVATSGLSGNPPMSLINSSYPSVRWDIGPNTNGDHVIFYNNNGAWLGRGNPGAGWNLQSDLRLKDEIEPIANCLDKITALRPVSYRWKYNMDSPYKSFGLIAQEAKDVIPEIVNALQDSTHGEIYGITYTTCIPILIGAVKELSSTIMELQAANAATSSQMADLQVENTQLKSQMASLLAWAQTQGFSGTFS